MRVKGHGGGVGGVQKALIGCGAVGCGAPDHDNGFHERIVRQCRCDRVIQHIRHEQRCGTAVAQDRVIDRRGQQRVQRDRNDPGLERPPEDLRKFDGIQHQHRNPLFRHNAMLRKGSGHPPRGARKIAIGQAAPAAVFPKGNLAAAPLFHMTIDEIAGCIRAGYAGHRRSSQRHLDLCAIVRQSQDIATGPRSLRNLVQDLTSDRDRRGVCVVIQTIHQRRAAGQQPGKVDVALGRRLALAHVGRV